MNSKFLSTTCSIALITASAITTLSAQEVDEDTIIVDGKRLDDVSAATKSGIPAFETPVAISTVDRDIIDDTGAQTIAEALFVVPGVTLREQYYSAQEFNLRGFYTDPSSSYYLDGRRIYNDVSFDTEMLESIEIVRGPASVLYGGIEPGGLIALSSKKPLDDRLIRLKQDIGSWDDYRTTLDISMPFGNGGGFRAPITYRTYDSFRDYVDDNRNFQTAPSLVLPVTDKATIVLSGFYTHQERVNDNIKIPILNGEVADIPRERFLGQPDLVEEIEAVQGDITVQYDFAPNLSLRSSLNASQSDKFTPQLVSFFGFEPDSTLLTRFFSEGDDERSLVATQHDLTWTTTTGQMDHTVLFGIDAYTLNDDSLGNQFGSLPSIDIFDPVFADEFVPFGPVFDSTQDLASIGFYAQDQITLIKNRPGLHSFDVLIGGRWDSFDQDLYQGGPFGEPAQEATFEDSKFSPRVGAVWMPHAALSIYATWSQSFSPQRFSFDANGELVDPQEAEQVEAGVKYQLQPNLTAAVSVFELTKTNVLTTSLPGLPPELNGEETSRGIETELTGQLSDNWSIAIAYTYLDAFVSESGTLDNDGSSLASAPEHSLGFLTSYTLPNGFGGSASINYVSEQVSDQFETITLDGYTLAGLSGWYRPAAGPLADTRFQITVANLFDEEYFLTGNGFGTSVQPGEPRSFLFTVSHDF